MISIMGRQSVGAIKSHMRRKINLVATASWTSGLECHIFDQEAVNSGQRLSMSLAVCAITDDPKMVKPMFVPEG